MKRTRLTILALVLVMTALFPGTISRPAVAADTYYGELNYRVRGPAAAPYGIGSGLLVGGVGVPLAVVRMQNMLRTALDVITHLPAAADHPSMKTVSEWAHEGIPFDLSRILPVVGTYDVQVNFTLQQTSANRYELEGGTVTWRASNRMNLSDGEVSIIDNFDGSGSHTLDPAQDTITLRLDRRADPATFEMDVNVTHPNTLSGSSEFIFGPMGPIMTMEAQGGRLSMGGLGMGFMAPGDADLGEIPDGLVGYAKAGGLDQLHGIEIWRDLLDNAVMVEYNLYSTLRADAGGPYNFEMGVPLTLDGQRSEGAIIDWTWTFEPGPGCADGPALHSDAKKTGERTSVTLLCDTRIILEVEDAQGNRDTDEVSTTKIEREWEIPFIGPQTRQEADRDEGRLERSAGGSILARAVSSGAERMFDVTYTSGENVSFVPAPAGTRDDLFIPPGSGQPTSWDDDGYVIAQVSDPGGPFDGMYYLQEFDIKIHRRTLIHPALLPENEGGQTTLRGQPLFYDKNKAEGHDVDGYLEGIREHEFEHGVEIRKAIEAHDPAGDLDAMFETDRDALSQAADDALEAARLEVCVATLDPLPGGITWSGPLLYPIDDYSGWMLGNAAAGRYPARDRAAREAICR